MKRPAAPTPIARAALELRSSTISYAPIEDYRSGGMDDSAAAPSAC